MKNKNFSFAATITVSLFAAFGVVSPGCSSDSKNNSNDASTIIGDNDASTDAGGGSSGNGGSSGTSSNTHDSGITDGGVDSGASGNDAGNSVDAGSDAGECAVPLGTDGCFNCPSGTAQFLNRCTNSTCEPFDNAARLPHLLANGGLPPLQ